MTKLRTIVVSLAICLPSSMALAKGAAALKNHPNLMKAEKDLAAAKAAITKSQGANECVFGLEGGNGKKAKEQIEAAEKEVLAAAEWVNGQTKECTGIKGKKAGKVERLKAHGALKGHPNLVKAEANLINAFEAVTRSQEANECVFGIEGGHGQKAKEAIEAAYKNVYEAAEWVTTHENECKEWGKKPKK